MLVYENTCIIFFFFSSRRRHTRLQGDWSSDVCSSDLVHELPPRREHPLPPPLGRGVGKLATERRGQRHVACPAGEITLVQRLHRVQMPLERTDHDRRQHCHPIPVALPTAHHDLPPPGIYVLHPQLQRLEQPEA